jgi:hypothetical protein
MQTLPFDVIDRRRLAFTRWADSIPGAEWDYGANRDVVRQPFEHWANRVSN